MNLALSSFLPGGLDQVIQNPSSLIPQGISDAINNATSLIPSELQRVLRRASQYFPTEIDPSDAAKFILYFAAASLILGFLSRVALGKRSSLNHSLSSSLAILFIYAVSIVVYTLKPWNLIQFLSPLPFVTFSGDYLVVLPISNAQFPTLCSEILSLIILAFLVNLLDSFIPQGKSFFGWYFLRFLGIILSMGAHYAAHWAFQTYLPEPLVTHAPTVLLILLVFMLLSGIISLFLGFVIAITNPFLGAMYSFFFSNVIGKQLSKAIFTSVVLCGIVFILEYYGYTVICITTAALSAYIPLVIVLLALWYMIGHVL